jgi:hypothetical protein
MASAGGDPADRAGQAAGPGRRLAWPGPRRRPVSGGRQCRAPYATGTFSYPHDDPPGPHRLIYLKLAVPAGAPQDIMAYQQMHKTFPTGSTLQQLYDFQEFDAYREHGHFCAQAAVDHIILPPAGRPAGVRRRRQRPSRR